MKETKGKTIFSINLLTVFLILLLIKLLLYPAMSWWWVFLPLLLIPGIFISFGMFIILWIFALFIIEIIIDLMHKH